MARQFFVGGNFKMNPATNAQKEAIVKVLNAAELDKDTEVVIAPPALYLLPLQALLRKDIALAAQNCHQESSGAFTGEISAGMLVEAGVPWVVLGHSERRTIYHESSELIALKTRAALDKGLKVIFCIGETLAQREAGETQAVCDAQVKAIVGVVREDEWSSIVIAYEPVWAIGTGKVASPAQAQAAHLDIRAFVATAVGPKVAESIRIIYGGSVTAANCRELARLPDVDGFLVGGASLKPEFVDIVNSRK